MHRLLVNFCSFTWMLILETREKTIKFLTKISLSCEDKIQFVKHGNDTWYLGIVHPEK